MKTILVGNGFNIELGGVDYLNSAIINRFLENTKNKDYATMLYMEQSLMMNFLLYCQGCLMNLRKF